MSRPKDQRLFRMPLRNQQDVVLCRQRARKIAALLGAENAEQVRIATAVSEIARNAVEYAHGGTADFHVSLSEGRLSATITDSGPGIPHLAEVLEGRYESPQGLGCGILGAQRLMDAVDIQTSKKGTTVRMQRRLRVPTGTGFTGDLQSVTDALAEMQAKDPLEELAEQNRELARALQETQAGKEEVLRQNEQLGQLTTELRETNRGVLALYDELDSLHRLGHIISAQLDLDSLVRAIIEATTDLCAAEFGVFLYGTKAEKQFRGLAAFGELKELSRRFENARLADLLGEDFVLRDVLRIDDVESDDRKISITIKCGIRSYLVVPVFSKHDALLGLLVFGHRAPNKFSERSERILGAAALQAGVGMENARLYTSVQNASAAKDHFLATLSHELRTPLNPVFIILRELVCDQQISSEVRKDLETVIRNLQLEARLIDDLLDMTRIVQGKIHLQREVVDVHAVVQAAFETCAPVEAGKQIEFCRNLRATRHLVQGDATRLQQVLWNLLNNAIKFTPTGGKVSAITADIPGTDWIRIQVVDTGRGIDEASLNQIFRAFEQGEISARPEFGGLGLGLAISKHIVEAHRGEIFATSDGRDCGATFTVDLPLASPVASLAPSDAGRPTPGVPIATNLRILLVDDHPDTLMVMHKLLSRRGHHVFSAASAADALAIAEKETLDLLISDIGLPDLSGLDLMTRIRKKQALTGIALSGYGAEADRDRSRAAGFSGHLTKPVDIAALEALLGTVKRAR